MIAFTSIRDGNTEIYVMNADGSNQVNLTNYFNPDQWPAWSPDGNWIAFVSSRPNCCDIWVMKSDGSWAANITNDALNNTDPAWRPLP